jgi:hypothetical protein
MARGVVSPPAGDAQRTDDDREHDDARRRRSPALQDDGYNDDNVHDNYDQDDHEDIHNRALGVACGGHPRYHYCVLNSLYRLHGLSMHHIALLSAHTCIYRFRLCRFHRLTTRMYICKLWISTVCLDFVHVLFTIFSCTSPIVRTAETERAINEMVYRICQGLHVHINEGASRVAHLPIQHHPFHRLEAYPQAVPHSSRSAPRRSQTSTLPAPSPPC